MKSRSTSRSIAAALLATAWLPACGDPLLTAQDRGDVVFGLNAMVQNADGSAPGADYQVAVLYLNSPPATYKVKTEVQPGSRVGSDSGAFRIGVTDPPQVYPWLSDTAVADVTGSFIFGPFTSLHPPDGVRIGQLVIGPARELAALPAELDLVLAFDNGIGPTLGPHLPNTTITGYQVIYAEGVEPGDLLYPAFTPTHSAVTDGITIADGFTLVDARALYQATRWIQCFYTVIDPPDEEVLDEPMRSACLAANRGLGDCLAQCSLATCQQACVAAFPGQIDPDACLAQAIRPKFIEACGPPLTPRPYQVRVLDANAPVSVTLGSDDIRDGLWVFW